jgi:hypothetical protein
MKRFGFVTFGYSPTKQRTRNSFYIVQQSVPITILAHDVVEHSLKHKASTTRYTCSSSIQKLIESNAKAKRCDNDVLHVPVSCRYCIAITPSLMLPQPKTHINFHIVASIKLTSIQRGRVVKIEGEGRVMVKKVNVN